MRYKTNLQEPTFRATFPIFNKYFLGLFALFALARILGKIEWSWWWVSAPIWGVWVIDLIYFVAVIVYSYQNRKTL